MERKSGRGMNEDRMRKNLTKLAIFSICMTLFLGAAGITLVRVFAVTFSRTTEERMLEEVGDYKERIINQIERNFQTLNTLAVLVGESGLYQAEDFKQVLLKADYQNDFLVFGFFDLQGKGYVSSSLGNSDYQLSEVQPELQEVVTAALQGSVSVHMVNADGEFIIRADDAVVRENCGSVLGDPYLSPDEAEYVRAAMGRSEEAEFSFEYIALHSSDSGKFNQRRGIGL